MKVLNIILSAIALAASAVLLAFSIVALCRNDD